LFQSNMQPLRQLNYEMRVSALVSLKRVFFSPFVLQVRNV